MKKVINTKKAPAAIGAYSQAIEKNGTIFVSGQLPVNPDDGEIVSGVKEQTRQSLQNLKEILLEADSSLADVVKCEVFISDMDNFGMINDVYSEFFTEDEPARACVEVARLPKDVAVEISAVAIK